MKQEKRSNLQQHEPSRLGREEQLKPNQPQKEEVSLGNEQLEQRNEQFEEREEQQNSERMDRSDRRL